MFCSCQFYATYESLNVILINPFLAFDDFYPILISYAAAFVSPELNCSSDSPFYLLKKNTYQIYFLVNMLIHHFVLFPPFDVISHSFHLSEAVVIVMIGMDAKGPAWPQSKMCNVLATRHMRDGFQRARLNSIGCK
jgi:hypothetical protein